VAPTHFGRLEPQLAALCDWNMRMYDLAAEACIQRSRRLAEQADRLEELRSDPDSTAGQVLEELLNLVCMPLVGWERMDDPATGEAIPYEPERLGEIVTLPEAMELIVRLRDAMALGVEAKKGSGSQSPSSTASSAPAATPASAKGASPNGPAESPSSSVPPAEGKEAAVPTAGTADGS
jgi:hypothetical protein